MVAPEQDPRVDDLRQRLRALGYLDAGVDRFVLASARDARAPWLIALFASLRIGTLAAILLGPATAIGLSARLPTLVTGSRDAVIIAIYFGVLFGLVVATTAFVLSVVVSLAARRTGVALTRRAPLLSRAAGVIVTLGCLAYLTLWWQTVIAGVGWSAPAWTASALALAAAISLLLGHAVTVGSAAVVMASARVSTSLVSSAPAPHTFPRAQWAARLGVGLAAFGGAALLLTWADWTPRAPTTSPPLTVVSSGVKVRVIAIDGLHWVFFEPFSQPSSPDVPEPLRAALTATRIRFAVPALPTPQDPARDWTTVATGQNPEIHGVRGLETVRLPGIQGSMATAETSSVARALRGATDLVRLTRPSIVTGRERRSKTFWEVAASAGLRTAVVNWWATWPATEEMGTVLSDRATVRLDQGGLLDAEIAPATLYASLQPRWPALKARAHSLAVEALGPTPDDVASTILLRSAELDALQILLLSEVATPATDLSVLYLPGLDIARFAVREHTLETVDRIGPQELDNASARATQRYLIALNRLLGPVLAAGPNEMVMVITQPGRVGKWMSTAHLGSDVGRLSARGAYITSSLDRPATALDIAPTILYALGVPMSDDSIGKPMFDLFTREFVARYPMRSVKTYGPPSAPSAARSGQPLDQETIDRLRSLGYLK